MGDLQINTHSGQEQQAKQRLAQVRGYLRPRMLVFRRLSEEQRANWLEHDPLLKAAVEWAQWMDRRG